MKRRYVDCYRYNAMNALVAVIGKPYPKQPVKKFKASRIVMAKKLSVYICRAI